MPLSVVRWSFQYPRRMPGLGQQVFNLGKWLGGEFITTSHAVSLPLTKTFLQTELNSSLTCTPSGYYLFS